MMYANYNDSARQLAGVWTHEDVEHRLQAAMTTLRRIPMHAGGMPQQDKANWPEYAYNMADRAGWTIGANTPEFLRRNDADQNRTRLHATRDQIRELDEVLMEWLPMIRDRRARKVVFARSHVWPESERPMVSWPRLAREMHASVSTLKRWYRAGIRDIAVTLSAGGK